MSTISIRGGGCKLLSHHENTSLLIFICIKTVFKVRKWPLFTGSQEKCHWTKDHWHSSIHQTGDPHHYCVQSTRLRVGQRHLGAYYLRL